MAITPPFIVRTPTGDYPADTLDEAIGIASSNYRTSEETPEIVDSKGNIVFDPPDLASRL